MWVKAPLDEEKTNKNIQWIEQQDRRKKELFDCAIVGLPEIAGRNSIVYLPVELNVTVATTLVMVIVV